MLIGRDCRVVMGPCRAQQLLSIVALVPDSQSRPFRLGLPVPLLIPAAVQS